MGKPWPRVLLSCVIFAPNLVGWALDQPLQAATEVSPAPGGESGESELQKQQRGAAERQFVMPIC